MNPDHTIKEICDMISTITGVSRVRVVIPKFIILTIIYLVKVGAFLIGRKQIHMSTINSKKLLVSTNIDSQKLENHKYYLQYSLRASITDWYNDCKKEGLY